VNFKPLEFCEQKFIEVQKQLNLLKTAGTTLMKALFVLFHILYLTAKSKEPCIIGDTLLLQAAIRM
jgi:hypothetical protein